jgi:omega-hydroxy-beta-dihydromenaquinone-9 sulfotransferase
LLIHTFQAFNEQEIDANILSFYQKLMQRFLETKHLIPEQNLIEVRYEDLEADPLREVARIYSQFDLAFGAAKSCLEAYLATQPCYRKNQYCLEPDAVEKVWRYCQVTIDRWGYEVPAISREEVGASTP